MHPTKCLERLVKYSYLVSIILNYQFPKTMFADFLCRSWILIALAHILIALANSLIALAHTLIVLTYFNSTEKLHHCIYAPDTHNCCLLIGSEKILKIKILPKIQF